MQARQLNDARSEKLRILLQEDLPRTGARIKVIGHTDYDLIGEV